MRYKAGHFHTYTTQDGLLSDDIGGITCDRKGSVWVLARGTLHQWQAWSERFVALQGQENQYAAPLGFDAESGLWSVDDRALYIFRNGQRRTYPLPATWLRGVRAVAGLDLSRNIWLAAYGAPLLSLVGDHWLTIASQRASKQARGVSKMKTDYRDSQGQLWHGELRIVHGLEPASVIEVPTTTGLVKVEFNALFEDREENIWLSTDGRGLLRLHRQFVRVYSEGLPDPNVYNVYQSRDGTLWFGTWRGGLFHMGSGKNRIYSTADGLASNRIACVYEDRAGVLRVAVQNGLYRVKHDRFETLSGP
jgi:ligand-binding sensor domain-containing protein